jgi:hypothetical protein
MKGESVFMGKIKQKTNLRHWASLWLVMAMAVMTAIFLRGGIVVQAAENDSSLSVSGVYMIGDEEYDYEYNLPSLSVGDEVTLKVKAEGGTGNYNYQWYYVNSSDEGNTYEPVEEAQQDTLTVEKKKITEETYYCEVKDDGDNQESAWFCIPTTRTLTTTSYINDEETISIEARENDEVRMRVVAESIMDNPDYTYSWYKYDEETGESESADCQADTLTITKSDKNEIYLCYVSDGVNRETCSFYINLKSTVTINKRTYIINGESYDAEDDSLPSLSIGDNITLQVDAETSIEDGDVSYQWYRYVKSDDEEYGNYEKISDETSNTLAIKKKELESEQYYCEVSDKKTSRNADFSIPAAETLKITQSINEEENANYYEASIGDSVTMKMNATSSLGADKISYQWYDSNYEPIEGETGPTYTVIKGEGSESYYCYVDDTVNSKYCNFALNIEDTIKYVKKYINDKEYDLDFNAREGKKYRLSVSPVSTYENAKYTYKWYKEGEEENILGTDSAITVTKTKAARDEYCVTIQNDKGSEITYCMSLQRRTDNMSILSYINGEYNNSGWEYEIENGKTVELYVDAKFESEKDITYDWQKYDQDECEYVSTGETGDTYTTEPITSEEKYRCVIECDGYEAIEEFAFNVKKSEEPDDGLTISPYIILNGQKEQKRSATVDEGTKISLGVDVTNLPETIKESDISYEWHKASDGDYGDDIISREKEFTFSAGQWYQEYICLINVNGEYRGSKYFSVDINPNITAEIFIDGKLTDRDIEVESFEELYGKKLSVKAKNKVDANDSFSYKWYLNEEDKDLSDTSELILTKDILSGNEVSLCCTVTNKEGAVRNIYVYIQINDYVNNAEYYINEEYVNNGQYVAGEQLTLKVKVPDNVSNKMTYKWYDEDGNKLNCQKSECTVTMGNDESIYICTITDQTGRSRDYEFTLYPETKLVVQEYINDEKCPSGYYIVQPDSTVKLEAKVKSETGVTYQWYTANGDFVDKKLTGETNSVLSIKMKEEYATYQCLVTRGKERKWVYFEIKACAHTDTEVLPAVPATCEKDGLTEGKRCTDCGETIVKQEVVKATGHKWDNGKVTTPATTTATGVKTYTCSVCKKTKTEVIPKLPAKADTKPGKTDDTTKQPENTDNTTKKPATTKNTLKAGTKITDKKSKAVYKVTAKKTVQYTKASDKKAQKAKKVTVPSTITVNGVKYQVTAIAANAFKNNKNLKSIVIPKSVRTIGKQAFAGCKNLKSIRIKTPYLTKKSVGTKAFKGISVKAKIKVPKKQLKAYKKLLKAKGVAKSVKIK